MQVFSVQPTSGSNTNFKGTLCVKDLVTNNVKTYKLQPEADKMFQEAFENFSKPSPFTHSLELINKKTAMLGDFVNKLYELVGDDFIKNLTPFHSKQANGILGANAESLRILADSHHTEIKTNVFEISHDLY